MAGWIWLGSNLTMVLAVAGDVCCDPIYSIRDLIQAIRYVDKQTGYFVAIEKNRYTIGTALDDMPQYSDSLENRSSRAFRCRNIANLVFAIPRVKTSQFIGRVRPA